MKPNTLLRFAKLDVEIAASVARATIIAETKRAAKQIPATTARRFARHLERLAASDLAVAQCRAVIAAR